MEMTLRDVLHKAIAKEIEAQRLYRDLSQMVHDEAAQDAFKTLVRQEKGHQMMLEKYLSGAMKKGSLSHTHAVDFKIAEHTEYPELTSEMELKDVYLIAANREVAAHEFYYQLAQIHPRGETRKLLEDMAEQELKHKQKMEFLYNEVAFPQTDGG